MPLITTPYLARTLGPEGTGTYSYTISIVTYFVLFGALGLNVYGRREIAFVQDDVKKRSKIFYELCILRFVTMSVAMIAFFFTYCRDSDYGIYYKILLLEMVSNCIDISWFFQGMENFKRTALRNILVKIASVIAIFTFIKNQNDISTYLFIYTLTTLFGNVLLWIGVRKYIQKVKLKDLKILKQLRPIIALFIPQIAIQVYTVLDKTMLGSILNDMSEVGYYEQTQKIVKILLTIITSLGAVMMPRIAKCYADGDTEKIKNYMYSTFKFVFMLSFPLIFGIIAVSDEFVPIFFGQGYDKVKFLLKIMSLIILFISLSNITGSQYLLSTKRQKQFTISVVFGAIINAILNLLLIGNYKSLGAVIATIIAEFAVMIIQFFYIREDFKIMEIVKLGAKYALTSFAMFIVVLIVRALVDFNVVGMLIQISSGMICYFMILIITKDSMIMEIKNRIVAIKNGKRS